MEIITEENTTPETVSVIDIPLYAGTLSDARDHLIAVVENGLPRENRCVSATGAHGIIYARKHPRFKQLLHSFYMNLPDGMPGVWVGKLKGKQDMKRCYGPDFFAGVMRATADREITHFLCGGKEGVAQQLKQSCGEKFGNYNIAGTHTPPFKPVGEFDYASIAGKINRTGADIVWIGLSTPKQEQFAARLARHTDVHFLVTVGAAFDFHIGALRQAPEPIQKMGLEWLFRVVMEPGRLFKRYMEIVPLFLYYGALDLIRTSKGKRDPE